MADSDRPKRIMIVEDEKHLRTSLSILFETMGWEVVTAGDGLQGASRIVAMVRSKDPVDLIVTDLSMPVLDGLDLVAMVRHSLPEMPVVVLSGHLTRLAKAQLADLGCVVTVEKPFDPEKLVDMLASQMDQAPCRHILEA